MGELKHEWPVSLGEATYLIRTNDEISQETIRQLAAIEHILNPTHDGSFVIYATLESAEATVRKAIQQLAGLGAQQSQ